jgi:hypothetical protein
MTQVFFSREYAELKYLKIVSVLGYLRRIKLKCFVEGDTAKQPYVLLPVRHGAGHGTEVNKVERPCECPGLIDISDLKAAIGRDQGRLDR